MIKLQVNTNIFHYEVSSTTNIDILCIIVSIWKQHNFETIFTSYGVLSIQYSIEKGFVSREIAYSIVVNDHVSPIIINR